jgi:hypothetical protein
MALEPIQLNQEKDNITWSWTASGKFSVASDYEAQFKGSFSPLPAMPIWQAYVQPKCKFFAWLVIHDRILSASNMIKKNWPCNHNCSLCLCMHETTEHLLMECNYTEAFWNLVSTALQLPNYSAMSAAGDPNQWVEVINRSGSRKKRRKNVVVLCIFWWIIWKERNNMIFKNLERSVQQLANLILEEVRLQLMVYSPSGEASL